MSEATALAPATIGNLGVGFDVLGAAIPGPRDRVTARRRQSPGVEIVRLDGDGGRLPWEAERNTASVAATAVLARAGATGGLELEIDKGIPLAGGLGSSAASAMAAALAADAALGAGLGEDELLTCALAGEAVASGAKHADNVAPCLYGGIVLTPTGSPPRPLTLPVPRGLAVALLHPPVELATREARAVLGAEIPLAIAVAQWGRLAAFVAALYREDWELLGRSMVDLVAEPRRAHLVPGFRPVQAAALAHGALGCSLSGAGPSLFALCRGVDLAGEIGRAMADALTAATGLVADLVVGEIERRGAHLVSP